MRRAFAILASNPLSLLGLILIGIILICAIFADFIAPFPEHRGAVVDFANFNQAPKWPHLMGTDLVGRDLFSRIIYAYRISLILGVVVLGIAVPVGVTVGLIAGYFGRYTEFALMRVTDVFLSIPPLVLAMSIMGVLEPTLINGMLAVTAMWWPWYARLVYNMTRGEKEEGYVLAAELIGASRLHVMFREVLPNCFPSIVTKMTLDLGFIILIASSLSFLGLGVQPPTPDLGSMVADGAKYLPDSWWLTIFPSLAILIAVFGFNLIGDALARALRGRPMTVPTLDIRDLRLGFKTYEAYVEVLHGISLNIAPGERVALVGESGSGKSVTARIVLGLLQLLRSARISGSVVFEGRDLDRLSARERRRLRGTRMTMVFQDPTSSLNPVYRIGTQFHEVLRRADPAMNERAARERAAQMLLEVSIDDPDRVFESYPFQLSGGMNQRVMIAMALANEPALLIADEPGTALDVTVQAQTLKLMRELVEHHHTSVLFISHNLGVVREFADRVYVIYKGRIVEQGPCASVFERPGHAYTRALMAAVPRITGGGLPDIGDEPRDFSQPLVVHEGGGVHA